MLERWLSEEAVTKFNLKEAVDLLRTTFSGKRLTVSIERAYNTSSLYLMTGLKQDVNNQGIEYSLKVRAIDPNDHYFKVTLENGMVHRFDLKRTITLMRYAPECIVISGHLSSDDEDITEMVLSVLP